MLSLNFTRKSTSLSGRSSLRATEREARDTEEEQKPARRLRDGVGRVVPCALRHVEGLVENSAVSDTSEEI